MFFPFAVNSCNSQQTDADKEKRNPQCHMAVIARLRTGGILAARRRCNLLNLKIRTALAVVIDNCEFMRADRKRFEVIGF